MSPGATGGRATGGRASGTTGPAGLDEFLHTPARLSVMSLLAPAEWVRFSFLRDSVGTSDSALSKQLSTLEAAGYVETAKERGAGRGTSVRLTPAGRTAFDGYLAALEELVARSRARQPTNTQNG